MRIFGAPEGTRIEEAISRADVAFVCMKTLSEPFDVTAPFFGPRVTISREPVGRNSSGTRVWRPLAQPLTSILKPPQNMRLPSKGKALGSIMFARRGSFITLALMRSRCARDLYTM